MTPPPDPSPQRRPQMGQGLTRSGQPADQAAPSPPPMRVVTKGWWTVREEPKTVDELGRERSERI